MKDRHPKTLWDQLRQALDTWMGGEPEEGEEDPTLLFHLCLTAPLLIGLVSMLRRS
jgi:hypothetical protein